MLRNLLASPDIIGITSGASAAAVVSIVVLSLSGPVVSVIAVIAGLGVALLVYVLAVRNGAAGTRLYSRRHRHGGDAQQRDRLQPVDRAGLETCRKRCGG